MRWIRFPKTDFGKIQFKKQMSEKHWAEQVTETETWAEKKKSLLELRETTKRNNTCPQHLFIVLYMYSIYISYIHVRQLNGTIHLINTYCIRTIRSPNTPDHYFCMNATCWYNTYPYRYSALNLSLLSCGGGTTFA